MKKCLFLMLMFVSVGVMAQEPYKVFCELLGTAKLFSNKVTVTVDFGQETSFWLGASKGFIFPPLFVVTALCVYKAKKCRKGVKNENQ